MSEPAASRSKSGRFVEVATLEGEEGVVASISQRVDGGFYSFSLGKAWTDREGVVHRTNYLTRRHLEAARKMLDQVETWFDENESPPSVAHRDR